jgi:hypothetical protein
MMLSPTGRKGLLTNMGLQFKLIALTAGLVLLLLAASCGGPKNIAGTPQNTPNTATATNQSKFVAEGAISLSADLGGIKKGASFSVNVVINTSSLVRGAQWSLQFDASLEQCESFQEGPFLKDWAEARKGSTLVFPQPKIDNTTGKISDTGIAIMSQTPGGVSGQGVLGTYRFTALSDSPKMPALLNVRVADDEGNMSDIKVN